MLKVPYGQNPYDVIGKYIRNHITVIEDIIAVIEIDGSVINTLFMVDMDEDGYFIWNTDWYEGEKNVVLIDFFPVSEATKSITQPEIIRCKDCKHKPTTNNNYNDDEWDCGFNIEFPDYRCPCQCEDGYYNWLPEDNWFCGNAERKTDG